MKYYLIQFTWGLPLNILGLIAYIILVEGMKFSWYQYRKMICIVVPWNFGGVNLGCICIHGERNGNLVYHEYGHSIQNLYWGWLMPFVIAIPSMIRYWYREFLYAINKAPQTKYDDIWFEGQATDLGRKAHNNYWCWL